MKIVCHAGVVGFGSEAMRIMGDLQRVLAWLQRTHPDIVCLQELKAREEAFSYDAIRAAGYHAAVYGQRTFNGVGILSRIEPQNVLRGMDGRALHERRDRPRETNGREAIRSRAGHSGL